MFWDRVVGDLMDKVGDFLCGSGGEGGEVYRVSRFVVR